MPKSESIDSNFTMKSLKRTSSMLKTDSDETLTHMRISPRKTDSEESKFDLKSLVVPMVTVTPSPSNDLNLSPRPQSPTQSYQSLAPSCNFSNISHPSTIFSAGTIPSVSSVSLNLISETFADEPIPKENFVFCCFYILIILAFFGPLLYFQDPFLTYFYICYGFISLGAPLLYFKLKPKALSAVINKFIRF